MAQNVKVAVRVRPFNKREKELKCELVVDMVDPATKLIAYKGEKQRSFTFDYSFWSFDAFQETPTGYLKSTAGGKYADQKQVFDRMGVGVLNNAFKGYNCTLFAYGQTGSGKSYSMIGYGENKGIVPITCQNIFTRIKQNKDSNLTFDVKMSMLQIYNEVIQDLLIPIDNRPPKGLQIRQNPKLGVYVDGAKKVPVTSYEAILKVMDQGTKNRTVASTQMNATSSRAHTIIEITFTQLMKAASGNTQKVSVLNLVDLAGSQRQSKTGAQGQRLKQAVGINQSLSNLGLVISALADNAQGKKTFVPYRNSALTRVLQNALGGNSQTIMICAISPANDNYQQTLSTLRYADQAKKIKNKPIVNESETDKLIRNLKEENQNLKKMLAAKGLDPKLSQTKPGQLNKMTTVVVPDSGTGGRTITKEQEQMIRNAAETQKRLKELTKTDEQRKAQEKRAKEKLDKENQQMLAKLKQRQQNLKKAQQQLEKLKATKVAQAESKQGGAVSEEEKKKIRDQVQKEIIQNMAKETSADNGDGGQLLSTSVHRQAMRDSNIPHLQNINRDDSISKQIRIYLSKQKTTVGKKTASQKMDIIVGGVDVKVRHCTIINDSGKVFITPNDYGSTSYINGVMVNGVTRIYHMDRVVFGWNSCFVFKDYTSKETRPGHKAPSNQQIDWDYFRKEMPVDIDKDDEEQSGSCCMIV